MHSYNELADSECDTTAEEYMTVFMSKHAALYPQSSLIWRLRSVKACVTEYVRKKCYDLHEVASDNDDDKDDDDDDANSKDVEVVEIVTDEALIMLGRLVNLKDLSKAERNSCRHKRWIREDKSAEQKAKSYQWLFYAWIKFVW